MSSHSTSSLMLMLTAAAKIRKTHYLFFWLFVRCTKVHYAMCNFVIKIRFHSPFRGNVNLASLHCWYSSTSFDQTFWRKSGLLVSIGSNYSYFL